MENDRLTQIIDSAEKQLQESAKKDENIERSILEGCLISVNDDYAEAEYVLQANGVGFFAKGDIHAIGAKQKGGKTSAIAMMIPAILNKSHGPLTCGMENPKVLFIDTEMNKRDTQKLYKTVLSLSGMTSGDDFGRFQVYSLRSLDIDAKRDALQLLIKDFMPDIIFVDGIVDMVKSFNDEAESKDFITNLMRLSTKEVSGKDIAIVCVLHTNKSNDDNNMRGHLGTILSQKCSTNLLVEKHPNGEFTVWDAGSRHQELIPWSFKHGEDGLLSFVVRDKAKANANGAKPQKGRQATYTDEEVLEEAIQFIESENGCVKCKELKAFLYGTTRNSKQSIAKTVTDWGKKELINIASDHKVTLNKNVRS